MTIFKWLYSKQWPYLWWRDNFLSPILTTDIFRNPFQYTSSVLQKVKNLKYGELQLNIKKGAPIASDITQYDQSKILFKQQ